MKKTEKVEEEKVETKEPSEIKEVIVEEEKLDVEKDVIEVEGVEEETLPIPQTDLERWNPKTSLGKKVKIGEIKEIDQILDKGEKILEKEIVEILLPNLENELLMVGQSKGKFGGGARRVFKQTQKKTPEGNKPSFACFAVVGNKDGYIGGGYGKSKDTVPSREKAIRKAKLNVFKIRRGCGSWQCGCKTPHSIPFQVIGKCGSVEIKLMPAPKGKGLCIENECSKILRLAGIKDVWSKTKGQTKVKQNLIMACFIALKKLMEIKVNKDLINSIGMIEGKTKIEV